MLNVVLICSLSHCQATGTSSFTWMLSTSLYHKQLFLMIIIDALKACRVAAKPSAERLSVCLPLYKNLIALEMAYGRIDSARGICHHLLKDNPSVVVLWLCLAALEDDRQGGADARQVYEKALEKCRGHAMVAYSAARFYLEKVRSELLHLTSATICSHYRDIPYFSLRKKNCSLFVMYVRKLTR